MCRTAPSWPPSPAWRWWSWWRRSSACSQACSSSPEPSGASRRPADRDVVRPSLFFHLLSLSSFPSSRFRELGFGQTVMDSVSRFGHRERNMRALRIAAALFVAAALLSLSLAVVSAHDDGDHQGDHQDTVWVAIMRGAFEVPARDTPARGLALFFVGESSVDYVILVKKISNVFAAHIHCGVPGVAGPVGVTLFMGTPGSGPVHGVLVRDSFSAPDPGN